MKKGLTEMVFILDRSGSMSGLESDTIGGFNAMIETQKKAEGEAKQRVKNVWDEYASVEQNFYNKQSEENVSKKIGCPVNERYELAKEYLDELGIDKEDCKRIRLLNSEAFINILKKLLLSEEGKLLKKDCKGILFYTRPAVSERK